MEKDIDKIQKNADTEIIIRVDDFGGKRGVTIREFVRGERYTGFTKAGTRIPIEHFSKFKEAINSIDEKDLLAAIEEQKTLEKNSGQKDTTQPAFYKQVEKKVKKKPEQKEDASTQPAFSKQVEKDGDDIIDEIEEKEM